MLKLNLTNITALLKPLRTVSLSGLLLWLVLAALNVPTLAQGRAREINRGIQDDNVPRLPLARDDPRAQLDPQLRNAPPMPVGAPADLQQRTSLALEPTVIEFDPASGAEKRLTGQAAELFSRQEFETLQMSGDPGTRTLTENGEAEQMPGQLNLLTAAINLCTDDQTPRYDSRYYPWSTQVKLYMTFPNGGTYVGSGTLIGSKYVITHQNNLYWPAFGGWATRIEAVPGLDGYYKPFMSAFMVYERYYLHGSANVGLITLNRRIGDDTGWLGYGSFSDAYLQSRTAHLAGYAEYKEYGRLYYGYNWATARSWDWLTVATWLQPGEMGAGVYLKNSVGDRYVHSVAAGYYGCATAADRITDWIFGQIHQVIANGQ